MTGGGDKERDILRGAVRGAGLWLLLLTGALLVVLQGENLTFLLFRQQDAPILIAGALLLLALAWRPRLFRLAAAGRLPSPWLLIALVFVVTAAGTWLVFGDYALSRDEVLADFDADFLRAGLLIAPVPMEWRSFAAAMMPIFMLPVPPETGWISGYLPGNAALRALFDLGPGRAWTGPVLAAVALLAVWRIARRLWPDRPRLAVLPPILLALSPQFLAMAMTPYAMAAHLAFNMLWLWCFLRGDRRGDAGALAAGFVATGLHQILFHPLFVAPFILELLIARKWRRASLYVLGYAGICLFWVSYWQLVLAFTGVAASPDQAAQQGLPFLLQRLSEILFSASALAPIVMSLNLLRFIAWNHLLLVPLVLLAWPIIRRGGGVARPLALGILLLVAILIVLLPWQGHGWGYRYLHGFLGSFALLAAYGWERAASLVPQERLRSALVATSAAMLLILPFALWSAHGFVRPYRDAQHLIDAAPAEVVIVDPSGTLFAQDLVRNRPDVSNRPVVVDLFYLEEPQLRALCGSGRRIALFDRRHAARSGIRMVETATPPLRPLLDAVGCAAPLPLR